MIEALLEKISDRWRIVPDTEVSDEDLINIKANQLHIFMLLLIFIVSLLYTVVGWTMGTPEEAIVTAIPMPVMVLAVCTGRYCTAPWRHTPA